MAHAIVVANTVYLERGHAGVNTAGHLVEHARVDHAAAAYALYLLGRLHQVARWHELAFLLPVHHLLVKLGELLPGQGVPSFFL